MSPEMNHDAVQVAAEKKNMSSTDLPADQDNGSCDSYIDPVKEAKMMRKFDV